MSGEGPADYLSVGARGSPSAVYDLPTTSFPFPRLLRFVQLSSSSYAPLPLPTLWTPPSIGFSPRLSWLIPPAPAVLNHLLLSRVYSWSITLVLLVSFFSLFESTIDLDPPCLW